MIEQVNLQLLKSCRVFILPGRCPPGYRHTELHNSVYKYWKNFWKRVFKENNTMSEPDANIFYRQDMVIVLMTDSNIIGTMFCTENNIASDVILDIDYFSRPAIDNFCLQEREQQNYNIATYEMLTVNPEFRRRITGIPFSSVLLGLAARAFKSMKAEFMIGPVRLDNGVQKLVYDFGWELISEEYQMYGTPVALSALSKSSLKPSDNKIVRNCIPKLWKEKTDLRINKRYTKPQTYITA